MKFRFALCGFAAAFSAVSQAQLTNFGDYTSADVFPSGSVSVNDTSSVSGSTVVGSHQINLTFNVSQNDESTGLGGYGVEDAFSNSEVASAPVLVTDIQLFIPLATIKNLGFGKSNVGYGDSFTQFYADVFHAGTTLNTQKSPIYSLYSSGTITVSGVTIDSGPLSLLLTPGKPYHFEVGMSSQIDVTGGFDTTRVYKVLADGSGGSSPVSATFTYQAVPEAPGAWLLALAPAALLIRRK